MAGQVTQSVHFWHQPGDTQKDKAEKQPGFSSPRFTGGETEARAGGMMVQEPAPLRTDRSNITNTDELNNVGSTEIFFFSCFFKNKNG